MKVFLDRSFSTWILGAIIRETVKFSGSNIKIRTIRNSRKSLFGIFDNIRIKIQGLPDENLLVNQNTYFAMCKNARLSKKQRSKARVFYTHGDPNNLNQSQLNYLLDVSEIIVMNTAQREMMTKAGFNFDKISICYGAVNYEIFYKSHNHPASEYVYISGDVKERKCPEKILSLAKEFKHLDFVFFGEFWHNYILKYGLNQKNIRLAGTSLSDHGFFLRNASCYLTLSKLEGGPYGTIEALSSGTPVVCTPTGWNQEVVNNSNGFLIGFDASLEEIACAIEKAFVLKRRDPKPSLSHPKFNFYDQAQILFKEKAHG